MFLEPMQPYKYSRLPDCHIRLLTLNPLIPDPPSGALTVVSLDDNPEFHALSYAWGDPGDKLDLFCSGQILSVYENLGNFIRLASAQYSYTPLWIDAICINQEDDAEKNHQIPLMGKIYSNAARTLVWLGINSKEEDEAFAAISILTHAVDSLLNHPNHEAAERYYPSPYFLQLLQEDSLIWRNIAAIFSRPWFKRLWAMQEVVLSGKISVLCGLMTVEWETLHAFVKGVSRRRVLSAMHELGMHEEALLAGPGFGSATSLGILKGNEQYPDQTKQESYTIAFLLRAVRERIARKAVDKVYGALAIMPPSLQQTLVVNVNMTHAQVYANFTRCLLERGNASLTLGHVSYSMKVEGLPSWCPDFAEAPTTVLLGTFDIPGGFTAGKGPSSLEKELVKLLPEWDTIEVVGFEVDIISEVVGLEYIPPTDIEANSSIVKWDETCVTLAENNFDLPSHNSMFEIFCKTIVAGGRLLYDRFPLQPASKWVQDHKDWMSALRTSSENGLHFVSNAVRRFQLSVNAACKGRQFFISEGKLMGLGPLATQARDLICILYGRPTPFILRPNPDNSTYRLIGEAYVDGIMDGEAFAFRDKYSLPDKAFVLK
jgi:Heterokaryon incompatibility protein (HET)